MTAPKRRWFRFSLRTLLFFVAAVTGLAWIGMTWGRVRQHNQIAREAIESEGMDGRHFVEASLLPEEWALRRRAKLPYMWSLLGAEPMDVIVLDPNLYDDGDLRLYQRYFPEADVTREHLYDPPPATH
jgi:hypothetical protein